MIATVQILSAERFGVNPTTVQRIGSRETMRDVASIAANALAYFEHGGSMI
jgi:hypothetical protein